jgi:hypothetical protein
MKNQLFICYDSGFKLITELEFPISSKYIRRKNLTIKTDKNLSGELTNERTIPNKIKGETGNTLTEMFLIPFEYENICIEIGCENPVFFNKDNKCLIMVRKQPLLLNMPSTN